MGIGWGRDLGGGGLEAVVDPGGDGPLRQAHLWIAPPPVDVAVKSRSLPVQGHDPQSGDRAAPPHPPPLPLLQTLESGRARTRVPHCSAGQADRRPGGSPVLARHRSPEARLGEAEQVRAQDWTPAERAAPPSGSGALCSGRNARSSGAVLSSPAAASTAKESRCKPALAAC